MRKRILISAMILLFILNVPFKANSSEEGQYIEQAGQLKLLGVFQGTDSGFELLRQPTRLEGLVMLIRLLGKEADAKSLISRECIFSDVPDWGRGYVNFAVDNGLTKGIGGSLFGSKDIVSAQSFTTFMLRALGYQDSTGDFKYEQALQFAEEIGMYSDADVADYESCTFLRDHVAKVSVQALGAKIKTEDMTLLEKLVFDGSIDALAAGQINTQAVAALEVHFIDVGQADCILITKGDEAMLIDGGNELDSETVIDYINAEGVSSLEYVIATHPHEDHIGGLSEVIEGFDVKNVIMPDIDALTGTFDELMIAIGEKELAVIYPVCGTSYDLNGAVFTILAPISTSYEKINDYSIVIKLTVGSNSFLFTGDAEEYSESEMISSFAEQLKSDVLKVGHHGSDSSTSQAFLDIVDPSVAVISVGEDNDYGHPSKHVLERLIKKNILLFRTDEQGTIVAISNGNIIVFDKQAIETYDSMESYSIESAVAISSVDKFSELVTLTNNSTDDIDISGWELVSVNGNQRFVLPSFVLKANSTVTIASGGAAGDLIWTDNNVWNNSENDSAELYDQNGHLMSHFEDLMQAA